jgi:hypothetical protein
LVFPAPNEGIVTTILVFTALAGTGIGKLTISGVICKVAPAGGTTV